MGVAIALVVLVNRFLAFRAESFMGISTSQIIMRLPINIIPYFSKKVNIICREGKKRNLPK